MWACDTTHWLPRHVPGAQTGDISCRDCTITDSSLSSAAYLSALMAVAAGTTAAAGGKCLQPAAPVSAQPPATVAVPAPATRSTVVARLLRLLWPECLLTPRRQLLLLLVCCCSSGKPPAAAPFPADILVYTYNSTCCCDCILLHV